MSTATTAIKAKQRPGDRVFSGSAVFAGSMILVTLAAVDETRGLGLYRLEPHTGKTHQLRLHMASLGLPILHDPFWPELRATDPDDFDRPLQLLSRSLELTDPLSGLPRRFESRRALSEWAPRSSDTSARI